MDSRTLVADLAGWVTAQDRHPTTIAYGSHEDNVADLLVPDTNRDPTAQAGTAGHPVAILLHGGFWRAGYDRTLMAALACDLAARGWASLNVEYRRGPGVAATDTIGDVQAAVASLTRLDVPVDRDRTVVIGHSAGGHLALCCARGPHLALIISLAGVADLTTAARERIGTSAVREFLGAEPSEAPQLYADADPIGHLPTGQRTLLVHGDADDRVPIGQSRAYHERARDAGDDCDLIELPGVDHFAVIDPRAEAWKQVAARLP